MAALTRDRNTAYSLGDLLAIPVAAATQIFAGSLVCCNAAGYAVPADDAVGYIFMGVAEAGVDNRLGDDGDLDVVVRRRGRFRFASDTALDQSTLGACVFAVDDQTIVADEAEETNDVFVGILARVEAADDCWVDIAPICREWEVPTTTTAAGATTTPAPETTTPAVPPTTTTAAPAPTTTTGAL
jgi:hypothetical protein